LPSGIPPEAGAAPLGALPTAAQAAAPATVAFAGFTDVALPRVHLSDDLPDLLDGRARKRRAVAVVIAVALTALLGTIAAAIASHYRPM
jgi:hypothetical protein